MGRKAIFKNPRLVSMYMEQDVYDRLVAYSAKLKCSRGLAATQIISRFLESTTTEEAGEKKGARKNMMKPDGKEHKGISIVVANEKGGVAKTTSCAAFAVAAAKAGSKVLLIDFDKQGNLSSLFGHENSEPHNVSTYINSTIIEFEKEDGVRPSVLTDIATTRFKNIDIIPSFFKLDEEFNLRLQDFFTTYSSNLVEMMLNEIKEQNIYDYILIDTSPYMNKLSKMILRSADYAVFPTNPDQYGIEGASKIILSLKKMSRLTKTAEILGVFFTNVVERTSNANAVPQYAQMFEEGGVHVFATLITSSPRVDNARAMSCPVNEMYANCKVAQKYKTLWKEMEAEVTK